MEGEIYVHDTQEIRDDGETLEVPSLNTYGEIRNRESLAEAVSSEVNLDDLSNEVGNDIGVAEIVNNEVESISLYPWVLEKYGFED